MFACLFNCFPTHRSALTVPSMPTIKNDQYKVNTAGMLKWIERYVGVAVGPKSNSDWSPLTHLTLSLNIFKLCYKNHKRISSHHFYAHSRGFLSCKSEGLIGVTANFRKLFVRSKMASEQVSL